MIKKKSRINRMNLVIIIDNFKSILSLFKKNKIFFIIKCNGKPGWFTYDGIVWIILCKPWPIYWKS